MIIYSVKKCKKGALNRRTPAGTRAWGVVTDPDVLADMVANEYIGQPVKLTAHAASF